MTRHEKLQKRIDEAEPDKLREIAHELADSLYKMEMDLVKLLTAGTFEEEDNE